MGVSLTKRSNFGLLNKAHPDAEGLKLALPMFKVQAYDLGGSPVNIRDLVTQKKMDGVTSSSGQGFRGNGLRLGPSDSSGDRSYIPLPDNDGNGSFGFFNDYTVSMRVTKTGAVTQDQIFGCDTYNNDGLGTGNRDFLIWRTVSPGGQALFWWDYNSTTGPQHAFTWTIGDTYDITMTRTGGTTDLFLNGVLVKTGAGNANVLNMQRAFLGTHMWSQTTQSAANCVIDYAYIWDRGMNTQQVRNFHADPWAMFKDESRAKKYFEAVAAGGILDVPAMDGGVNELRGGMI